MPGNPLREKCEVCGYSMTGHPSGATCPECGVAESEARRQVRFTQQSYEQHCAMIAGVCISAWIVSIQWRYFIADWEPISPASYPTVRRTSIICAILATTLTIAAILLALRLIRRSHAAQLSTYAAEALIWIMTLHLGWILWLTNLYFLM